MGRNKDTLTPDSWRPDDFVTGRELVRRFRIIGVQFGERPIRRAIRKGEIATFRPAGTWPRHRWGDALKWLRQSRVPTTDHAAGRVAELEARENGA